MDTHGLEALERSDIAGVVEDVGKARLLHLDTVHPAREGVDHGVVEAITTGLVEVLHSQAQAGIHLMEVADEDDEVLPLLYGDPRGVVEQRIGVGLVGARDDRGEQPGLEVRHAELLIILTLLEVEG